MRNPKNNTSHLKYANIKFKFKKRRELFSFLWFSYDKSLRKATLAIYLQQWFLE